MVAETEKTGRVRADPLKAGGVAEPSPAWRSPSLVIAFAVVLVPMAVAIVEVLGRRWTPAGDVALEMLQVSEVGTAHTPLTGAWSRWGWNHPGPLLFYVLAPFTWLFGNVGALVGVTAINLLACAGA